MNTIQDDPNLTDAQKKEKEKKIKNAKNCKLKKSKTIEKEKKKKLKKVGYVDIPNDMITPLVEFPLSIPLALVKGIILMILMIIGQIIHICLPPGPLTALSCPEAGGGLINIYQLFQWDDKNSNYY